MKITPKTMFRIMKNINLFHVDLSMINIRKIYHFSALIVMTLLVPSSFMYVSNNDLPNKKIIVEIPEYLDENRPNIEDFRDALSTIESEKGYDVRRSRKSKNSNLIVYSQYWGRYQLGKSEREAMGLGDVSWEVFSKSPALQDAACNLFIATIREQLINHVSGETGKRRNLIEEFSGKVINHQYITESGMIAMAHNSGVAGLKQFLLTNGKYKPKDGFETSGSAYLSLANYSVNIPLDVAKKNLRTVMDSLNIK